MPSVLSKLLPPFASAYAVQALLALVLIPAQNEVFFDLCGALGFWSSSFVSLFFPQIKASLQAGRLIEFPPLLSLAPRQLLISTAVGLWATRLGVFCTSRALQIGDSRFDEVKKHPLQFARSFAVQATWVFIVGLPAYLTQSMPASAQPPLGKLDYAGLGLWASSFLVEVVADWQKARWRSAQRKRKHEEKFITKGLWGWSKHPNYLGEVGLWTGMWVMSASALKSGYYPPGTVALGAVSPFFTYYIIRYLTGIPPLEKSGDKEFGGDAKWKEYKKKSPSFFLSGQGIELQNISAQ